MNLIIPFTKDIKFNSSIAEITSISLEHDYTVNDGEILGNFIVSGDYKSHELSVNKEHFEYVLPFSVELTTRIDRNSVDFSIEDFTYEIKNNDTLEVRIEYSVNALEEKKETKEEVVEEEPLFERVEEDVTLEDMLDKINEDIRDDEEAEETDKEDTMETEVIEQRDVTEDDKKTIIDSINDADDAFVTYHIHIMKETDTIDTVCTKYNTTSNILSEYNDLSTVAIGDKLIIPDINE
ncbi:MAG TPA: hypothetical protein IAB65_01395 [Candidatus Onthocola stercorigallinarum]|nr:hypothetical protein [Candidatus Onthocola stercorigallinarum]